MSEHPRHQLADELSNPVRFSLAAALAGLDEAEFAGVRDYVGKRPRTWLSLTASGRMMWDAHLAALRSIVGEADR